jgi:photosystem II stability/assembly factor-like uncharacterized protein
MKIINILICSLLFTALWSIQQVGPSGISGWYMAVDDITGNMYVSSRNEKVYKVTQDEQWQEMQFSCSVNEEIQSLTAYNNTVFIGTNEHLYRSLDGGQSWSITENGLSQAGSPLTLHIYEPEPEIVFAQMGFNMWYRSENNGSSWSALPTFLWCQILAYNTDTNFILLINNQNLYKSYDKGKTWIEENNAYFQNTDFAILSAITIDDSTYIIGGTTETNINDRVFITYDGGVSWQNITFGYNFNFPSDLEKHSTGIYMNAGRAESENRDFGVYKLDLENSNWIKMGDDFAIENNGLYIDSYQEDIIFLSFSAGIFKFNAITNETTNINPIDIYGQHIFFCNKPPADNSTKFCGSSLLFRKDSNMQTWTRVDSVYNIFDFAQSPYDSSFCIASSIRKGIYISEDGGNTWQPSNNGIEEDHRQLIGNVQFLTDQILVISGKQSSVNAYNSISFIYRSEDKGQTWTKILQTDENQGEESISLYDLIKVDNTYYARAVYRGIVKTEDLGLTWETVFQLPNRTYGGFAYQTQTHNFYINTSNHSLEVSRDELFRTQDFVDYEDCIQDISYDYRVIDFELRSNQPGTIFMSPSNRFNYNGLAPHLFVTQDDGNNWEEINFEDIPLRNKLVNIDYYESTDELIICPDFSSIYQVDPDFVGTTNHPVAIPVYQLANHPNPFNPSTNISFILPEPASQVKVNIYNPKGQKIRTLSRNSLQQGEHSLVWNGKDDNNNSVASGVYLYRLQVDGKTKATSKCLLLK